MKVNAIISLLLFAAGADAQAEFSNCDEYKIITDEDCSEECKSRANKDQTWDFKSVATHTPNGTLVKCECTYSTGNSPEKNGLTERGFFTCTRDIPAPSTSYLRSN